MTPRTPSPSEIEGWFKDLDSAQLTRRRDASKSLAFFANDHRLTQITEGCSQFVKGLSEEKDELTRRHLSQALAAVLSNPNVPPEAWDTCYVLLTDPQAEVRHELWAAYSEKCSCVSEKTRGRLLKLASTGESTALADELFTSSVRLPRRSAQKKRALQAKKPRSASEQG